MDTMTSGESNDRLQLKTYYDSWNTANDRMVLEFDCFWWMASTRRLNHNFGELILEAVEDLRDKGYQGVANRLVNVATAEGRIHEND